MEKDISIFRRIFKSIFKIFIVISFLLFLVWLPLWFYSKPANDFCNSFTEESHYKNVMSKAKELKYRVFSNMKENNGTLSVETQNSPFFRVACFITFQDNKIIKKEVRNSD
ncbi:MAG: hypothetical protein KAG34_01375 [Cocleimonas sp.]|nr:hypothetical protein [Cocleimonas sp.]